MSVKHLYLLAAGVVLGCASSGSSPGAARSARTSNVLSGEDIVAAHADITTAYDAVARLRPNWLAPHGVMSTVANGSGTEYATVYLDGQRYGDLSALKNIVGFHVQSIRYYNVTEAGARYGIRGGSSGVIDVTTNLPSKQ
jgi:hypothetical protein